MGSRFSTLHTGLLPSYCKSTEINQLNGAGGREVGGSNFLPFSVCFGKITSNFNGVDKTSADFNKKRSVLELDPNSLQ